MQPTTAYCMTPSGGPVGRSESWGKKLKSLRDDRESLRLKCETIVLKE